MLLQHNFDEVHKYKDWTTLLKNFYDNYPDLNIVYTGSAMLAIENSSADLSRRQSLYTLHGLSFREYLEYENVINLPPIGLESLVADHVRYAMDAVSEIRVLKYFDKYLMSGYYPYYKEAGEDYLMRLSEVAGIVIESDIPAIEDITYATMQKMKSLLMVIAENVPLEPNINKLSSRLESTRDQTLKMLYLLDRAALRSILTEPKNSIIKQYVKLFEMDGVKLEFEDAVFEYIVDKAVEYKLGARGLRSIVETIMMDAMFEIPSERRETFTVTLDYAKHQLEKANIARLQNA